jgi:hypothetical protein
LTIHQYFSLLLWFSLSRLNIPEDWFYFLNFDFRFLASISQICGPSKKISARKHIKPLIFFSFAVETTNIQQKSSQDFYQNLITDIWRRIKFLYQSRYVLYFKHLQPELCFR